MSRLCICIPATARARTSRGLMSNSEKKFVVKTSGGGLSSEYTLAQIVAHITTVMDDMDDVVNANNSIDTNAELDVSRPYPIFLADDSRRPHGWHLFKVPLSASNIKDALDTLSIVVNLRKSSQDIINTINNGQVPYMTKFIMQSPWPGYNSNHGYRNIQSTYSWSTSYISEQAICPLCKETYSKSGLKTHMGSLACMRDQQRLDVRAEGYEMVQNPNDVRAILKSGVDFKVRPSGMDMWVPSWVLGAIESYHANGNNFAGMKLAEYLTKIKGE
jgi:hypothetical protein